MQNTLKIEGYELLSQKVYQALKEEIVRGFLEPRTILLENKFAKEMHVSGTPIREAMRKLVAERLVKNNSKSENDCAGSFSRRYKRSFTSLLKRF